MYTDLPAPVVNIAGPPGIFREGTAGDDFNLMCIVTVVEYLIVEPTVQWSGGSVGSGNGVMVGDTTHSGVMSMKTLRFSPLCTSHTGAYNCQAIINIPLINEKATKALAYVRVDSRSE